VPVLIAVVAALGLAIGSFLNVVIHRVPLALSLSSPSSHCPSCGHPIRNRHNVPVLGWFVLRGRCFDCAQSISARYPLVELTCGLLFVAVTLRVHHLNQLPALPAYLYFVAMGIALAMIDIDCHRLPNSIVLPSYPVIALMLTIAAVLQDESAAVFRVLIGGLALFGFYALLMIIHPRGMGYGDVKLAGLIGALLAFQSYSTLLVGAFLAFLLGALAGVIVIASRRGGAKTAIPFGPFMIGGALIALFIASPIARFYLDSAAGG
jgi:leader peptidase (prepilin peptidase) / N-methyltransferase